MLDSFYSINYEIIRAGVILAIFLAFSEFLRRREKENIYVITLAVVLASIQLRFEWLLDGSILENPDLVFGFATSIALLGPLLFFQGVQMVSFDDEIEKPDRRHLLFPGLVAILDCIFVFIPHETQVRFIRPFESTGLHANPMMMMSVLVILVYLGSVALHLYRLRFKYELRYNGLAYSIIIGSVFAVLASCIGYFAGFRLLFHLACTSMTVVIALTLLYSIHYPDFFQTLQKEMEKKRYEKTQLTNVDLPAIKASLSKLFDEEHIYRDDELRLADLGRELNVSPNQLSRILNEQFGKNFYEFVNSYRIEEAKQILISQPARNVIDVGMEVGFVSKSTFNSQFLKATGMTPSGFRKYQAGQ